MIGFKARATVLVSGGAILAGLLSGGSRGTTPVTFHAAHSLTRLQARHLSGTSEQALLSLGVLTASAATANDAQPGGDSEGEGAAAGTSSGGAVAPSGPNTAPSIFPGPDGRCAESSGSNVRMNTACENYADAPSLHGRSMAQNETAIAASPVNRNNLVASANDYMRGDGNCGAYYTLDGGSTWNGTTAPMLFVKGSSLSPASGNARQYWQAGGDTDVAYDSKGTAFLQCQVFNRGAGVTQDPDTSSAVLIFRSANGGASWDFPGRVALSSYEPTGAAPNGVILEDKPLFTIDNRVGSPYQDRIYLTWTSYTTDGAAYINETQSADGGETWSSRKVIGGNSATLCTADAGSAGTPSGSCNNNQFSDPFVGPDGTLYVAYANYNNTVTGSDNRNQILLVKSTDGGATFSAPVKVTDFYDLPDCATYTGKDPFRSCVVNKGATKTSAFRAASYPSGAVDPTNANHVVVNIGSYINANSDEGTGCAPNGLAADGFNLFTGAGTQACNNQILQSESTDGGSGFTGTSTDPRSLPVVGTQSSVADEWFQWTGFTSKGAEVVGYYDRQYGNDNNDGSSDYSLTAAGRTQRVTTASSPPPTEFGGVFFGDYDTLAVSGNSAYLSWADDRNPGVTSCAGNPDAICRFGQDEDAFTATVAVGGKP